MTREMVLSLWLPFPLASSAFILILFASIYRGKAKHRRKKVNGHEINKNVKRTREEEPLHI